MSKVEPGIQSTFKLDEGIPNEWITSVELKRSKTLQLKGSTRQFTLKEGLLVVIDWKLAI